MNTYLLLRNNKESGPHSLDEIRALGLKAYDLVWVVGKSAAWRYPGEIDELKSFAPPIDEQPFDRFFKKPVRESSAGSEIANTANKTDKSFSSKSLASTGAVYINLPASKKIIEERIVFVEPKTTLSETAIKPVSEYYAVPDKKRRNSALMAAGIILLFGVGFVSGMIINGRGISSSQKALPASIARSTARRPIQPASVNEAAAVLVSSTAPDIQTTSNTVEPPVKEIITVGNGNRKKTKATSDASDSSRPVNNAYKPSARDSLVVNQPVVHKNEFPGKDPLKSSIEDYVYLTAGKYSVGTFGGISNIQLTIGNEAAIALDLVVVEVQYILSNKKVFKTENVYFHNIPAGSSLMQEAPKSPRGIKVRSRITMINSRQTGLSFTDM